MFEKRCSACGGKIDKKGSITSYDVRVSPQPVARVDSAAEYQNQYGTTKPVELMQRQFNDITANVTAGIINAQQQRNGVTAVVYHSHDYRDCIEAVNAGMADAALGLENMMFVRMHVKVGKKIKFDCILRNFNGHLDMPLDDKGAHKVLEAQHSGMIVSAFSSKLEGRAGSLIPILLATDNELVVESVRSQKYQDALRQAEQDFKDAGGYGKGWPVRLNALTKYYASTSIRI